MIIGFTGTREGITDKQRNLLIDFIKRQDIFEFHHGDCVGADKQAHDLIREYKPKCKIIVHPPIKEILRAFCKGDIIEEPREYIERDQIIVDRSDLLLACPLTLHEVPTSGTWKTIKYARKIETERIIFGP